MDGSVLVWKLHLDFYSTNFGEKGRVLQTNPVYRFDFKYGRYSDIAVKTESKTCVYAVTEDYQIKEINKGKEIMRYESSN